MQKISNAAKEELEDAIKDTIIMFKCSHQRHHKKIIFGSDTPACMMFLEELRKQQIIDQKIYDQKLMEDTVRKLAWEGLQRSIVMDGDTKIDSGTGEVLNPEVDCTYWKEKF